jgi:hypothetical protein
VEEASADQREAHELERDHDHGDDERGAVVRDQEGECVQDPAEERRRAGDRAADRGVAATRQAPVSDSPSEKAMLTPAPMAVASPAKNACVARQSIYATRPGLVAFASEVARFPKLATRMTPFARAGSVGTPGRAASA